ncbi:MAG: hypothetical protein JXB49_35945 [Bacteroidales bacterium]|nr:hypothetical protein [Bacteroidales bacterium]
MGLILAIYKKKSTKFIDDKVKTIHKKVETLYKGRKFIAINKRKLLLLIEPGNAYISNSDDKNKFDVYFFGTIYNYNELISLFNNKLINSDAELFKEVYIKYAFKGFHLIYGEYLGIIMNNESDEIIIINDCNGSRSLYYCEDNNSITFSNSLKSIIEISNVSKEVNERYIVNILTSRTQIGSDTAYSNVYKLPAAHYFHFNNNKSYYTQYWSFEDIDRTKYKDIKEYNEHFFETFDKSIHHRLKNHRRIGISLSSGFDSSTVAYFLSKQINNNIKVSSYTSVPLFNNNACKNIKRLENEGIISELVAQQYKLLPHILINSHVITPIQGLYSLISIHAQPHKVASNYYWLNSIFKKASEDSIDLMLNGQFGNGSISFPSKKNIDLLRFKDLKNLLPNEIYKFFYILLKKEYLLIRDLFLKRNYINPYSPIDEILGSKYLKNQSSYVYNNIRKFLDIDELRYKLLSYRFHTPNIWSELGDFYNMEVSDPTADRKLVELCYKAPIDLLINKGQGKGLIYKTIQSNLPEEVLNNKYKGLQTADIESRIINSIDEVNGTLNRIMKSDLVNRFINIQKMEKMINFVKTNRSHLSNRIIIRNILNGIQVGLFIEEIEHN